MPMTVLVSNEDTPILVSVNDSSHPYTTRNIDVDIVMKN